MVELAAHADRPVQRREIAARQAISANYVAQLFGLLREAGLVRSVKGPGGGYMLTRAPDNISVGDVLRAVEGPMAIAECLLPTNAVRCQRLAVCAVQPFWLRLNRALEETADSTSLRDLCHAHVASNGEGAEPSSSDRERR
jgi:Rrf2 family protein